MFFVIKVATMNDLCMKRIWKSHRIVTVCYDANANTISKHNAIVLDFVK